MRRLLIIALGIGVFWSGVCRGAAATHPVAWEDWSDAVFQQAAREKKLVLLDLGTQWCHWCHVMDVQTYADPGVRALIAEKFIAVRADADARPDLASRYEDYGWPATIVFNAQGGEIVKRQGYLPPAEMASMLRAIIADPTPGPSVVAAKVPHYTDQPALTDATRQELLGRLSATYDWDKGGWGHGDKYLDWDNVEWSMRQAAAGDANAKRMATQTLNAQYNLLDPAWGGIYQYSTNGDWNHPHFEKIMQVQAEDLRIYSLAYAQWRDPGYLHAAESIHHFLTNFLRGANGAFYTSQDADLIDGTGSADYFKLSDAERRQRGIPRVDTHQYARENGWAIRGLTVLYETTGDSDALKEALAAADWAIEHRSLAQGGFTHDQGDVAGPYLGDTLAMGQAFLELYAATADRAWLNRAEAASDFVTAHFIRKGVPGAMTVEAHADQALAPTQELDENVAAARWANLLAQYSGRPSDAALARSAMEYLATPEVAMSRRVSVGGILLADDEMTRPAVHIVIVGSKSDRIAAELYRGALSLATSYKRVEWYDAADGPLPNADVEYPKLGKAAAFVCTGTTCSRPAFTMSELSRRLAVH